VSASSIRFISVAMARRVGCRENGSNQRSVSSLLSFSISTNFVGRLRQASVAKTDSRQFLDHILLPWRDRSIAYMNDSNFGWIAHKIGETEQNVRQAFLEEQHKGIYIQMIRRFEKQANR
jgi:hypothetical protein